MAIPFIVPLRKLIKNNYLISRGHSWNDICCIDKIIFLFNRLSTGKYALLAGTKEEIVFYYIVIVYVTKFAYF